MNIKKVFVITVRRTRQRKLQYYYAMKISYRRFYNVILTSIEFYWTTESTQVENNSIAVAAKFRKFNSIRHEFRLWKKSHENQFSVVSIKLPMHIGFAYIVSHTYRRFNALSITPTHSTFSLEYRKLFAKLQFGMNASLNVMGEREPLFVSVVVVGCPSATLSPVSYICVYSCVFVCAPIRLHRQHQPFISTRRIERTGSILYDRILLTRIHNHLYSNIYICASNINILKTVDLHFWQLMQ